MPSISSQYILVIGGSSGIGAGVAKLALAEGARVAIASSNPERVANAVKKLEQSKPGAQIEGYTCDLSGDDVESRLEKLFEDVTAGGNDLLDHIVYTSAIFTLKPISEITLEYLRTVPHLAVFAPLLVAKLSTRFLKEGYTSSLVFTSGRVAEKPIPTYTVGTAFATAVFGYTRNLALDLAPRRVNVVSPGATVTEMWGGSEEERAQRAEAVAKTALLGKVGTPEEVAEAYIYLMKDTNATGSTVSTSGGALLQ